MPDKAQKLSPGQPRTTLVNYCVPDLTAHDSNLHLPEARHLGVNTGSLVSKVEREGTHSQAALTLSHLVGTAAHSGPQFPLLCIWDNNSQLPAGLPFGFNGAVVWDTDSVTNSGSWFASWKGVEWEGWGCRGFQQSTKKPLWAGPCGEENNQHCGS